MHAVIVGLSDPIYEKLVALCKQAGNLDHSWYATHLLEEAIANAPLPGHCKGCGTAFAQQAGKIGPPYRYCSEKCREKGYRERKLRWWKKRGKHARDRVRTP